MKESKTEPEKMPTAIRARVLVVNHNANAGEMLQMALSMKNYEIRLAYNGKSAIEIAAKFQPNAVILDIGLPDIDGYEVGKRLREKYPNLLIMALSGWEQDEDRCCLREAGLDYHLVKPVKIEEVEKFLFKMN